uniref:Uncharacterized protein n=1 Tax=Magnetospirillum gryphiswaldense TaxID=55518 RepID=A4TUJ8_9PROT|nr:hypothetical protein MGR_1040 [Magnetospirillum gryphiswaldense MSR-1]
MGAQTPGLPLAPNFWPLWFKFSFARTQVALTQRFPAKGTGFFPLPGFEGCPTFSGTCQELSPGPQGDVGAAIVTDGAMFVPTAGINGA